MASRRALLAALGIATGYLTACSLRTRIPGFILHRETVSGGPGASPVTSTVSGRQIVAGVFIDTTRSLGPISPLIYRLAGGDTALWKQVRPAVIRWGGTPSSRYNWRLGNAWNAARDWQFRNGNYGHDSARDRQPSGVADQWLMANRGIGAASLLTIPALGWVAKDDKNSSYSIDVPAHGGPALPRSAIGAIAGYDPANNRQRTSVKSAARGGAGIAVAQQDWVRHMVSRFGGAEAGGVRFYAVDNEPDLWGEIHTDVHPARVGYDEAVAFFAEYARAIKAVDPAAKVTGPVVSGWTGYFYSGLDRGTDNFQTAADRRAHGGAAFLPWWLEQVHKRDVAAGQRTLDYLDVHYYPQGGEYPGTANSPKLDVLRLRSTRSLWDPSYVDESWIARTWDDQGKRGIVELLPRLKRWVAQSYPGTKIAITE
ncbi:MAG: glycoside hydrolase family 44 protein, partial [Chloroflexi bacterium]|nr:glycoside hydrolase family 44 protein [Chloroflexota bacterium]